MYHSLSRGVQSRGFRNWIHILVLISLAIGTANQLGAQGTATVSTTTTEPQLLITAEGLSSQLTALNRGPQSQLLILDTRKESDFAAEHIPGAIWFDVATWKKQGQQSGGFQDQAAWGRLGSAIGLTIDRPVVVYGAGLPDVTRAWWLLKYIGVRDVKILDGGWTAWQAQKGPVSQEMSDIAASKFQPKFDVDRLIEIDELMTCVKQGETQILDTRSLAEYEGETANAGNAGRIPGSVHLDWTNLVGEDGRFKSPDELKRLIDATGFSPDRPIVTYCASGGRATVDAFVIEMLGYPKPRVYSRSFEEWGAAEQAPKVSGKNKSK